MKNGEVENISRMDKFNSYSDMSTSKQRMNLLRIRLEGYS
jgi:hypothetical protein